MRLLLFVLLIAFYPVQVKAEGGEFFSMTDVPLMIGFEEQVEHGYVFDKPEGRIVEAVAVGRSGVSYADVLGFYKESLMQLGWVVNEIGFYRREGEILKLLVEREDDSITIKLNIFPKER